MNPRHLPVLHTYRFYMKRGLPLALLLVIGLIFLPAPVAQAGASVTVSPATVTAGSAFAVSGSGFQAGETVNIQGPTLFTTATADASGNISATGVRTSPQLVPASYTVSTVGQTSGNSALTTLSVSASAPSLSLATASVQSGASSGATAAGFDPGENVCFTFGGGCSPANTSGTATASVKAPPDLPAGTYVVRAGGQNSLRVAFANWTVTASSPSLTTSGTATPGSTITATASGFLANEPVKFNGGPFSNSTNVTANGSGQASETFTVPCIPTTNGWTGEAIGQNSGLKASVNLSVGSPSLALSAPSPVVAPSTPASFGTIGGGGFGSSENVSIVGPFSNSPVSATTTGGSFSTTAANTATMSAIVTGYYTIDAYGTTSQCDKQATVYISGGLSTPSLSLAQTSVVPGQTVTVSGSGFTTTSVTISGPFMTAGPSITVPISGGNLSTTFQIGSGAPPGTYNYTATGGTTLAAPLIISSPSTFSVTSPINEGTTEHLSVTNVSGTSVTFQMPGISATNASVSSSGAASASPVVAWGPDPGTYFASASSNTGQIRPLMAPVTLQKATATSVSLSGTSLTAGTNVSITGAGFGGGETVQIGGPLCASSSGCTLSSAISATSPQVTATTDSSGSFTASAFVPYFARTGTEDVHVTGKTSGFALILQASVTGYSPSISLSSATVASGGSVTVTGSGFAPNESVVIGLPLASSVTTTASSTGTFSATLAVGSCVPNGTHSVTAQGQTSGLGANAPVTVNGGSSTVPAGCGYTPAPSVSSSSSPPPTTTTTVAGVTVSTTTSQSGGVTVVGTAAPNTGVADIPATMNISSLAAAPLAPAAPPPIDPAAITGTVPAPIIAQVSAKTGGVILAGNAAIIIPPAALAQVPGGLATFDIKPAVNLPVPGGPAQYSPNGSVFTINIADKAGNPITTFPVLIPIEIKYNPADVGQARGNPKSLTAAYVVDALTPLIANPLHFPLGTFVIFPPEHSSLNAQTGTITVTTQAIGSSIAVVTNPVGYVQTVKPDAQMQSSFDPATSQSFGAKPQFSYLQVVEPQIGTRLLVVDPDTGNYAYVDANDVGPSGAPPNKTTTAVVRGLRR